MPTYEYVCAKCETEFEVFQSMKDAPLTTCPNCGKKGGVKRRIGGGAGLIFKGTGFYITDYKAKKPSGSGESPSSKPSESKPAPAAPAAAKS